MDAQINDLVARLHASPLRCVLAVSGAGSEALAWLLAVPGASGTVLEATVPYSRAALLEMLGSEPASLASPEVADELAKAAYERALILRDDDYPVAGVACTSAISSNRPKRGDHRAHVAVRTENDTVGFGVTMGKGGRDRAAEERVASLMVLRALASAAGIRQAPNLGLNPREHLQVRSARSSGDDPIDLLASGTVNWVRVAAEGSVASEPGIDGALMPGSFNPMHAGHVALREAAGRTLNTDVTFELSITNVDKPELTPRQVKDRLIQMGSAATVILTRAHLFSLKARLFPGTTFVVGYDTAIRLVDPVYHGGEQAGVVRALEEIRDSGCRLLVAGRMAEGAFHSLADLEVPGGFEDLFAGIPESVFRWDGSSTKIRETAEETEGAAR